MPTRRTTATPSAPPRSLADALRGWDEDALATLLRDRSDLAVPLPHDLTGLAVRAASRASTQRAVDALDTPTLQILEILAVLPEPTTTAAVSGLHGTPADAELDRVRALALVWGDEDQLRLVRAVRDLLGPYPAGLGPPLADCLARRSQDHLAELAEALAASAGSAATPAQRIADHLSDPTALETLLNDAPDGARTVLDRLTWGPPVGRLDDADRPVRPAEARTPVRWLLAHGLLAVADPGTVVLPREVAVALRGGRVHRPGTNRPPELSTHTVVHADQSAALAAADAVRLVEALGEAWGTSPPAVLRSGGLGVRDLKRLATQIDVDTETAARLVETAYVAGLVGADGELDPRWAPTPSLDDWCSLDLARRWACLAGAWLTTTRSPVLVGTRDAKDSPRNALGPDLDRAMAPQVRGWLLAALADLRPDVAADLPSLAARLDWSSPRRAGTVRSTLLRAAHTEASWLGLLGGGALATFARPLLDLTDHSEQAAAQALDKALPPPVDHLLLQADLTAVVPGRLTDELARELDLAADAESRGGGAVYRFSAASLRRALDVGRTGDDLHAWLRSVSKTAVPQPLEYLIADTARRHGRVRVSAAQSFVRSDDEAVLTELLTDRRTASLRLRRLAPTVLAAQAPPETVLGVLRAAGLAPAAETEDGTVVLRRPSGYRTGPRVRPRGALSRITPPAPSEAVLRSAAAALLLTEAATRAAGSEGPSDGPDPSLPGAGAADPGAMLTLLHRAAAARRPVLVGYVEADGSPAQRLVEPIQVGGGRVSAFDRETARVRTFPIARVTSVTPAT